MRFLQKIKPTQVSQFMGKNTLNINQRSKVIEILQT